jgi:hypothetical protein
VRRFDVPLYRYGPLAWFWRGCLVAGVIGGLLFLVTSAATLNPILALGGLALIGPSIFFGLSVVVSADRLDDGCLEIATLFFWRRRIAAVRLGRPFVRRRYRTLYADLDAPRVWVPVKGGFPLYFDLLGQVVNRQELLRAVRLRADEVQRAE